MAQPPILLVHGAFGHPVHFEGWIRLLSQAGYRCRAPALPGHAPSDLAALARLTFADYLAVLQVEVAKLEAPPVIIGHSMGGLLAQQLAAVSPCRALVCVASAPPWMLTPPLAAIPYLLPILPTMLSGRPLQASETTIRALALNDLPEAEQRALLPTFGAESGRAYRAMALGLARLPAPPFRGPVLCLSGTDDRLISIRTLRAIARKYSARHEEFAGRGHWLIAPSAEQEVAGRLLAWLGEVAAA